MANVGAGRGSRGAGHVAKRAADRATMRGILPAAAALALASGCVARPQAERGVEPVESLFEKLEYRIPMRDGTRLFTAVYTPRGGGGAYPVMLNRTPYSVAPYGIAAFGRRGLGFNRTFAEAGFIFAFQDVRGRFMSEGEFIDMRPEGVRQGPNDIDESTDTYDTIDWLVKNLPRCNGRAGMWGISYPGFYAACGTIDSHPALRAISPQAPIADWFVGDDFHHNGALFLIDAFDFFTSFRPRAALETEWPPDFEYGMKDAYQFFLNLGPLPDARARHFPPPRSFVDDMMDHPNYDEFWKARNPLPHLRNVHADVMMVGGWYDAEDLYGPLHIYDAIERQNPGIQNCLVIGPWSHGGWARDRINQLGDFLFAGSPSNWYQNEVEFPFFRDRLKGEGAPPPPEVRAYVTGSDRWCTFNQWPPAGLANRDWYFAADGALAAAPPSDASPDANDEYLSDPAHPVPYQDRIDIERGRSYMIADQRFASRRPDVLTYRSEPLQEEITLAGPIQADLFISTTGTDADFIVKVIDVLPDDAPDPDSNPTGVRMGGYQRLVRAEVMRGRYRNSLEKPEPLQPGEVARVAFELRDVCHTFQRGHRLMVQVQSSWFPLVDRNPQTYVDIYKAQPSDYRAERHRVHRDAAHPSRIRVGVLPGLPQA